MAIRSGDDFDVLGFEHQRILTTRERDLVIEDFIHITELLKRCLEQVKKISNPKQENQIYRVTQLMRRKFADFKVYKAWADLTEADQEFLHLIQDIGNLPSLSEHDDEY